MWRLPSPTVFNQRLQISYSLLETSETYYHAKRFYNPQERELQLHCYGSWKLTKTTNFMNCYWNVSEFKRCFNFLLQDQLFSRFKQKEDIWNRHAVWVCRSVSMPLIEPLNNLTDLHVRVILKSTWPRRELLRLQYRQNRIMKQRFLILKMKAVQSFEISVVGTATMLRTVEKKFNS